MDLGEITCNTSSVEDFNRHFTKEDMSDQQAHEETRTSLISHQKNA